MARCSLDAHWLQQHVGFAHADPKISCWGILNHNNTMLHDMHNTDSNIHYYRYHTYTTALWRSLVNSSLGAFRMWSTVSRVLLHFGVGIVEVEMMSLIWGSSKKWRWIDSQALFRASCLCPAWYNASLYH